MKVIYEVKDRIARITINRPEAMNAMDPDVYVELSKAWTDVRDNADVWVAIVTGAGEKAFTAGADLKTMTSRTREKADFWLTVVHPSHVPIVNTVFTPSADEIAHCEGLIQAMEDAQRRGIAAVAYKGDMVDEAMVKTAREMLAFARSIGVTS